MVRSKMRANTDPAEWRVAVRAAVALAQWVNFFAADAAEIERGVFGENPLRE